MMSYDTTSHFVVVVFVWPSDRSRADLIPLGAARAYRRVDAFDALDGRSFLCLFANSELFDRIRIFLSRRKSRLEEKIVATYYSL